MQYILNVGFSFKPVPSYVYWQTPLLAQALSCFRWQSAAWADSKFTWTHHLPCTFSLSSAAALPWDDPLSAHCSLDCSFSLAVCNINAYPPCRERYLLHLLLYLVVHGSTPLPCRFAPVLRCVASRGLELCADSCSQKFCFVNCCGCTPSTRHGFKFCAPMLDLCGWFNAHLRNTYGWTLPPSNDRRWLLFPTSMSLQSF